MLKESVGQQSQLHAFILMVHSSDMQDFKGLTRAQIRTKKKKAESDGQE